MKIVVINIAKNIISGGYREYLDHLIPRLAMHPKVDRLLCIYPDTLKAKYYNECDEKIEFGK